MRVTIGIPTQWGIWRAGMALSLIHAIDALSTDGHVVELSPQNGPYLALNREASAQDAIRNKSDLLAFVDTDMAFPPGALSHLIARGKDVIGVNYYEKKLPLVSTLKMLGSDGELLTDGEHVTMDLPKEPFQVGGLGCGLLVVNVQRMVTCLAAPYFAFDELRGKVMGEDVAFCNRARKAGMQVWCDPTIPVAHIGDYFYGQFD